MKEKENKWEEQDIVYAAKGLLSRFKGCNKKEDGVYLVSEYGLENMSTYFGTVPKEERGHVFLEFLCMLYDHEYIYDVRQFLGMEEVKEDVR